VDDLLVHRRPGPAEAARARGGTQTTPPAPGASFDVVVVGAGVIGLSIAWKSASSGMRVAVVDPSPGSGSSWAAAGMLAPVTEVHYGEEPLLALNRSSAALWPEFARQLEAASGLPVGYLACGTLLVAAEEADLALLEELHGFQQELGLEVEWLSARRARLLEPNLAPGIRAAMFAAGDHQVDNRLLVAALIAAAQRSGCSFHAVRAVAVERAGNSVEGVSLEGGSIVRAPVVVLAAGAWSGDIGGVPEALLPPVRPVKGQIMRTTSAPGPPVLERTLRGFVNGRHVYLVPRSNGTVVIGGTVEEQGFDTSVTAGAVYEILRDAHRLVPAVTELQLDEAIAGLRPGSPDNAPIVGAPAPSELTGFLVATGHYRNGVLLAPLTTDAVCALLEGKDLPSQLAPFSPCRFQVSGAA